MIKFHSLKCPRNETVNTKHSKEYETPLPVYIGMKIHSQTRKRNLVDTFFSLGLSVSYDRVLEISTELANNACNRFESLGAVVPTKMKRSLFTTGAIDNIDHNPSSTTSQGSFHGTSLSVFQHPLPGQAGCSDGIFPEFEERIPQSRSGKYVSDLPEFYSNIHPAKLKHNELSPPLLPIVHQERGHLFIEAKDQEAQ